MVTQSAASSVFYRSNNRLVGSNLLLGFCVCVVLYRSRHFDGSVCRPGFYQTTYIQEAGHVACMKMNINVNKTFADKSEDRRQLGKPKRNWGDNIETVLEERCRGT